MKEYEQRATKMIMSTVEGVKAQIRKAYNKGYADGKAATPFTDTEEAEKKAYDRGLNDAWDIVRKIIEPKSDGGYSFSVLFKVFDELVIQDIFKHNTATEAIAKIKAYEDKQKQDTEIKVGDEVKTISDVKGIVITNKTDTKGDISVLFKASSHVQLYPKCNLTRTGKNYPQIAEVLAELRGAENDE